MRHWSIYAWLARLNFWSTFDPRLLDKLFREFWALHTSKKDHQYHSPAEIHVAYEKMAKMFHSAFYLHIPKPGFTLDSSSTAVFKEIPGQFLEALFKNTCCLSHFRRDSNQITVKIHGSSDFFAHLIQVCKPCSSVSTRMRFMHKEVTKTFLLWSKCNEHHQLARWNIWFIDESCRFVTFFNWLISRIELVSHSDELSFALVNFSSSYSSQFSRWVVKMMEG